MWAADTDGNRKVDLDEFRRERKRILRTLSGPLRKTFAQKLGYAERLPQQIAEKDALYGGAAMDAEDRVPAEVG